MRRKILIVPDKFKGTLTAAEAARAIALGWRKVRTADSLKLLPISDGGDGFGAVMSQLLNAAPQIVRTQDAAHRPCSTRWWWEPKTKTALIEAAQIIGLSQLPRRQFHPFELDTFGLGAVIRAACKKGARRCLIGIGGSATNDGGFGLARALDWQFLDRAGKPIERWTELHRLAAAVPPKRKLRFDELIVAVDVQNPLLGLRGATRVYGPQKGLQPSQFAEAERNLAALARVNSEARAFAKKPGSGAAGGLGFGLVAFLGARLVPGFEVFARHAELNRHLRVADLVITGEGKIDASTFMGKGVGEIARLCRELGKPCIALAGKVDRLPRSRTLFRDGIALTSLTTAKQAQAKSAHWLQRASEKIAARFVDPS